ncbi:uncharacterized protein B0T15DRAFT_493326 [Chaetomium strumarium]|uniref:LisH domain-containing protein n=1 Tax=Chaetomium strumarium TaxID=1170767 RepID=A0AAJ0M147_9PEZI|nr:hypothetical protein B0T15DRAFT_493326 [Chaetomium strumarium]
MANMPNMNNMGGPVGPPMNMMNNGGLAPPSQPPNQIQLNDSGRTTLLNTYIYDYFIRNHMFDCARAVFSADPHIKVIKDSPGKHRDENGNLLGNGDAMDTDTKDGLDQKRPDDLPAPNLPVPTPDSCFLYDWFCLFWDMFNSQKGKGSSGQINQYVQHTQAQSRMRQEQQRELLRQMRSEFAPQQYHPQMMTRMPNGAINIGAMKPGNLQRTAVANSQNPQTMHLLQKQAAGQMPRDPSEGNRGGPGSPGSAENAPSPSKRPRLDGGAPFNPNQGVMMPNGRPGQGMPGQPQMQTFAPAAPNAKTLAMYSTNMSQHHGNQMPNKPMPHAAGPQGQGSMVPPGPDGNSLSQYYNPGDLGPGNMRPGAPNGQATANSNHALQDYQMQLMLLEQQNKKRLMMARQEQDMTTNNVPRVDGPGGPGGPNAAPGPNGQGFQGTSPPGGRSGASPNPSESMKRNQQMGNPPNMGSPLPDGAAQSRSSPNAINFMGGNMDPNTGQHFNINMNMAAAQINGMRPPSSHPQFNQMNQQQIIAARQAQANAQGVPMQWQQGGPNGQMAGQPPQSQMQGGPAQNQRSMPPPSAPAAAAAAANAANARNTTASPQVTNAAPPTPQQGNKAAPKKKETKSTKAKPKKSNPNLNNAGATPAADGPDANQEAPTPATPITPANPAGFPKNQNVNAGQGVPNGQPTAPVPPAQPAPVAAPPPHSDPNQGTSFLETGGMDFSLGFADPMQSENVLDGFDFDTFLQDGNTAEDPTFDFTQGFSMEGDTTIGATD